ncbi:DUF1643 domain-containing protein [Streptomyces bobili]|uniref:DUF1643 domain-containing protein n=1 Tax=Streptomyces bobili TaxID=67280 RepID=UPI00341C486C
MTAVVSTVLPDLPGLVQDVATDPDTGQLSIAVFDTERRYRYLLTRIWNKTVPPAVWIMLNPSTADAFKPDATLTRCVRFVEDHLSAEAGGVMVVNLFALVEDPVGPSNDIYLRRATAEAGPVIAAWGSRPIAVTRAQQVTQSLTRAAVPLRCLRVTTKRQPWHPLYVDRDTRPALYTPPSSVGGPRARLLPQAR